ncbi:alpha-ketoglutarate-dependent dioxygenase alkB homolog 4 isoform X1 [Varanus komodoensis]|uniref:alpha-ketoglutarate-dependent dioxygenase alkB homolog 4 isoform X1 n=1 Tax=Varanus komodoensis TaxID=61221 RepID=UPI001CF7DB29|nr:alpha-ketoglutarate-dependent dioxygenase alkB homolog 4 isoform X1 [Varanus komodoensis]
MEAAARRGSGGGGAGGPGGCGCKGIRACLLCEAAPPPQKNANFVYCPLTGFAVGEKESKFAGWAFPFPGVFLLENFISGDEELKIVELMDRNAWKPSQSGRRKQVVDCNGLCERGKTAPIRTDQFTNISSAGWQFCSENIMLRPKQFGKDYGPKVNFKKRKLKVGTFAGLPCFSQEIVARMRNYSVLEGFFPVEQCNLDYGPERGSSIDPHWDDWWVWGERLVSLNLLSSTVLSMSCDLDDSFQLFPAFLQQDKQMYSSRPPDVSQDHQTVDPTSTGSVPFKEVTVAIHLPRRSLVVLYGAARYKWKHAIYRNHIKSRRICITFRELSAEFSPGGEQEELGKELLGMAQTFQGIPV